MQITQFNKGRCCPRTQLNLGDKWGMAERQGASPDFRNSFVSLLELQQRVLFFVFQSSDKLPLFLCSFSSPGICCPNCLAWSCSGLFWHQHLRSLMKPRWSPLPSHACAQPPMEKPRSHFPVTTLAQQHHAGAGMEGSHLLEPGLWVQILSDSDVTHQEHGSLVWVPSFLIGVFTARHTLSGGQGATQDSHWPKVRALPWKDICSLQTDQIRNVN